MHASDLMLLDVNTGIVPAEWFFFERECIIYG
jgi:hypothetical protein